jgi:hypothetical protein
VKTTIEHPGGKPIQNPSPNLGIPLRRVRCSPGGALQLSSSSSAGSVRRLPLENGNRCGRCGAALDRDLFCAACRTFFARLSADTARLPGR